jgi:UDPglucose 6-dehydrogenase
VKLAFLGTSRAAQHLSAAAADKGFRLVVPGEADVLFVSEDTPTFEDGTRDLQEIASLLADAVRERRAGVPIVLTSQVPPGFCRKWAVGFDLFHQAETLRIRDAAHRARHPEMLIVGRRDGAVPVPPAYADYLAAWQCPVLLMSWEEAEFAKIAINMTLAAQVDNTNRLAQAAEKAGARWEVIAEVLRHDARIGRHAYLTPGCWQDSPHLKRDAVTLEELER